MNHFRDQSPFDGQDPNDWLGSFISEAAMLRLYAQEPPETDLPADPPTDGPLRPVYFQPPRGHEKFLRQKAILQLLREAEGPLHAEDLHERLGRLGFKFALVTIVKDVSHLEDRRMLNRNTEGITYRENEKAKELLRAFDDGAQPAKPDQEKTRRDIAQEYYEGFCQFYDLNAV